MFLDSLSPQVSLRLVLHYFSTNALSCRQWKFQNFCLKEMVGARGACNSSFSGVRDQEDHSSKPAWTNSSARPYLEKPYHKNWAGGVAQGESPEFKPQYQGKKKKERERETVGDSS
jgi:hypothetical protein